MSTMLHRFASMLLIAVVTAAVAVGQTTEITIIHVNDSHAHLDAFGPKTTALTGQIGGIAKAATVIKGIQADADNVLTLHAGDMFVGDVFFNALMDYPELSVLQGLQFDAIAIGNHEFDLTPVGLETALFLATNGGIDPVPPLLSANAIVPTSSALAPYIVPSIIRTFNGVDVGIFGLTTPNPLNNPSPIVIDDQIDVIAYQTSAALRLAGCEVVICLSHTGLAVDQMLAAGVPGIDVIIGGHDHYVLPQPIGVPNPLGGTTWIAQAGSCYRNVGEMTIVYDATTQTVTKTGYIMHAIDASVTADAGIQGLVDGLKPVVEFQLNWNPYNLFTPAVATASFDIEETFNPLVRERDTPAGNLVTDAYVHAYPEADVAITALGLIADKMYAGAIVPADVFRLVPYGFDPITSKGQKLVTCQIYGAALLAGLEVGVSSLDTGDDFVIQVGGMTFDYNSQRPVGHRVIQGSVRIHNQLINPAAVYTLVTNEAIASLFDLYGIPTSTPVAGLFEYDAVLDHVQDLVTVAPVVEGRMKDKAAHPKEVAAPVTLALTAAPEPVRDLATVTFSLEESTNARLAVYDMLGRCVDVLAEGAYEAGAHQVRFQARELPAGVYFMRLSTDGQQLVRRLCVAR